MTRAVLYVERVICILSYASEQMSNPREDKLELSNSRILQMAIPDAENTNRGI